ncbi:hypothetical protein ABZW30_13055 [Kitasatospora sp. NPDC004669]|uniref:hypothetical protein n=1 Tax=Kitasatospora sp. NPDC004669 TaxID=3154555 RepID=UPI0033BD77C4
MTTPLPVRPLTGAPVRQPELRPAPARTVLHTVSAPAPTARRRRTAPRGAVPDPAWGDQ